MSSSHKAVTPEKLKEAETELAAEIAASEESILRQYFEIHQKIYQQATMLLFAFSSYETLVETGLDYAIERAAFTVQYVELIRTNPYKRLCLLNGQLELLSNDLPFSKLTAEVREKLQGLEIAAAEKGNLLNIQL